MAVVLLGPMVMSGCVRRRLMVRTNPPNASVFVDDKPIGQSNAATSFTYYGTRKLEIVADGYRTETIYRKFSPPWYQIPPLDFFFETLWPWELRDERIVDVTLVPEQIPTTEGLLGNGENLRMQASQGIATAVIPAEAIQENVFPPNASPGIAPQPSPYGADAPPPMGIPTQPLPSDFAPPMNPGTYQGAVSPSGNSGGFPTRIPEMGTYRPSIESGR
ncbi:MAG: PEGA domain-containing protein [Aureliella sp.]